MMQSVALTELHCNEEEFVIVEAPRAGLTESNMFGGSSRTLSSLAEDDDASYDYCDDCYSMPSTLPSQWDETFGATSRRISEEFNLPPNLTDTDVEDAVDYLQTERFPSLELSDTRLKQPYQRSLHLTIEGVSVMNSNRPSDSSLPSSVSDETKDGESTATEGETRARLPGSSSVSGSGVSSASSVTLTRLSNKKRRKQVLLAKKAAAAAAAAAKLAELKANEAAPSELTATGASTKNLSSLHKKNQKIIVGSQQVEEASQLFLNIIFPVHSNVWTVL